MIKETQGVVLHNVKYGDTSLICKLFTQAFGLQSYLLQGVRSEKKSGHKANLFQPGSILEIQVYHTPNKNLQRIREAKMHYWSEQLQHSMVRQSMLLFCIELFTKVVTQPETNEELYEFLTQSVYHLDQFEQDKLANFHLQFSLQLASLMGFGIHDQYTPETPILDLQNGSYVATTHKHSLEFVDGKYAEVISQLNSLSLFEGHTIALNREQRLELIHLLIRYLQLHVNGMGKIKSLEVLPEIL